MRTCIQNDRACHTVLKFTSVDGVEGAGRCAGVDPAAGGHTACVGDRQLLRFRGHNSQFAWQLRDRWDEQSCSICSGVCPSGGFGRAPGTFFRKQYMLSECGRTHSNLVNGVPNDERHSNDKAPCNATLRDCKYCRSRKSPVERGHRWESDVGRSDAEFGTADVQKKGMLP